ncbi:MAG TPA: transposase family protein [Thermotogota bacterium]|nr:transposase family protein [Thermotogota bacterium]
MKEPSEATKRIYDRLQGFLDNLDPKMKIIRGNEAENEIEIRARRTSEVEKCPYCGEESEKVHSIYPKTFEDLPVQGKKLTIVLERRIFLCNNPECSRKRFTETIDFIEPKRKRTRRLEDHILRISVYMSSLSAEKVLKDEKIDISNSAIRDLIKKKESRRAKTTQSSESMILHLRKESGTGPYSCVG